MPPLPTISYEQELRLFTALVVNAAVLLSAHRFALRRLGGDLISRAVDTFLIYYLVQYIVIGALGLAGVLAPLTIGAGAMLLSALLWTIAKPRRRKFEPAPPLPLRDRLYVWTGFFFVAGFIGAMVYYYRLTVPLANDAITYHIPAAGQWLRTGRLGLFETWFYNPANTYSPLAGSIFIAWLIAPFRSDIAARFVEVGPLLMLFWAMLELSRRLGAGIRVATLIAAAAVLARPFISHVNLAKDDLFVAAFFLAAITSFASRREARPDSRRTTSAGPATPRESASRQDAPREQDDETIPLAPREDESRHFWSAVRFGVAIGLMLATKYTALMTLPLLLLVIDAPFRAGWRWRHFAVSAAIVLLLAGPWYLRNAMLTGNPLYPTDVSIAGVRIFDGMMTVVRSDRLDGLRAGWDVMTTGYYPMPVLGMIVLLLGWGVAWRGARRVKSDALLRLVLIGGPLGIAIFLLTSPYAEMRFVYPSLLLLFAACAASVGRSRWDWIGPAVLLLISIATSFASDYRDLILSFSIAGVLLSAFIVGMTWMLRRLPRVYRRVAVGAVFAVALGGAYANWRSYANEYRTVPEQNWTHPNSQYRQFADAWSFVRNEIPPHETLAYTNLYLVHPLMGFAFDRPLVYAPTQPNVDRLQDLPHFPEPTSGERIPQQMESITWRDADRDTWLENLRDSGATYLIVGTDSIARPGSRVTPPEFTFATSLPTIFQPVLRDEGAIIYRVNTIEPSAESASSWSR